MTRITEAEFARICAGIREDRDSIVRHNPIGTPDETVLWMLMSCLVSYMNLSEIETPCFTGRPDAKTYRDAILFIVSKNGSEQFNADRYLDELVSE